MKPITFKASLSRSLTSRQKKRTAVPEAIWQDPRYFIAFGFGSGAMPVAPGTFGTLMAIPFYLVLSAMPLYYYLLFVILFIIGSSLLSQQLSKETNTHDHPGMCIDEFAGFFVTMIHAPPGAIWIILGFVLFRLFDILKPWPISWIDKHIQGGFGMILDDVVAGAISCLIIQWIASL